MNTNVTPDVSIIIPSYNRLWCLPRAIDSCRGTKCHTQIIVCDDGSSDGTWEWLQQQPDLVILRQANQGQTWAINHASSYATGNFIRFLDSDDFLTPGTIDLQLTTALDAQADVVYGRVDIRDEETGKIETHPDTPLWDDFIAVMLGEGYGSHFLGMMFRREFVANIPRRPEFALREDRAFLLEVALRRPRLAHTPGCAGYWTRHQRQMHTSYHGLQTTVAAWQLWKVYERTLKELQNRSELTPRRIQAASNILWSTAHAIARTHLQDAVAISKYIKALNPSFAPSEKSGLLRFFYRVLGYANTQRILRLRRWILGQRD